MFRVKFTPVVNGRQYATVRRAVGTQANRDENGGEVIIRNAPVSFTREVFITELGQYKFFAGLRSDPFFKNVCLFYT